VVDTEAFADKRRVFECLDKAYWNVAPCTDEIMDKVVDAYHAAACEMMAFPAGSTADLKFKLGVMMRAAERGDQSSTEWLAAVLADFDQLIPA
jgi:hypothetical protein